jgi:hypothetical protein
MGSAVLSSRLMMVSNGAQSRCSLVRSSHNPTSEHCLHCLSLERDGDSEGGGRQWVCGGNHSAEEAAEKAEVKADKAVAAADKAAAALLHTATT